MLVTTDVTISSNDPYCVLNSSLRCLPLMNNAICLSVWQSLLGSNKIVYTRKGEEKNIPVFVHCLQYVMKPFGCFYQKRMKLNS